MLLLGWRCNGLHEEALMELIRRLLRRMTAVSDWSLWSLPRWLTVFVLTVVAVDAAAIGVAASFTHDHHA